MYSKYFVSVFLASLFRVTHARNSVGHSDRGGLSEDQPAPGITAEDNDYDYDYDYDDDNNDDDMLQSTTYVSYDFDKPIAVNFINQDTNNVTHEISLDKYNKEDMSWLETSMWTGLCNDQESWNSTCAPEKTGQVEFNGGLPTKNYDDGWPLNPGFLYGACVWNVSLDELGKDNYTKIGGCLYFDVNEIPEKAMTKAKITVPSKKKYADGETIAGIGFNTKLNYQNQWMGLYNVSQVDEFNESGVLDGDNDSGWVITGCNDIGENLPDNGCEIKKKKGEVDIIVDTNGETGKYKLCIVFTWNPPYEYFSCDKKKITIK